MFPGQQPPLRGTCFVVMGFGKKTDFETGRTLDLDKTYKYIIKPAVIDAGMECTRADEIPHSGVIDVPMYEQTPDGRRGGGRPLDLEQERLL